MTITIKIAKTGPYRIEGEDMAKVTIVDHEGNPVPLKPGAKNIALCRCGASTTKPFCDGTHSRMGFLAAETAVNSENSGNSGNSQNSAPKPQA